MKKNILPFYFLLLGMYLHAQPTQAEIDKAMKEAQEQSEELQ